MSGSTDTGFAHIQLAAHSLLRPEAGLSPLRLPREEEAAHALLGLGQLQAPVAGDGEAAWVNHGQRASCMPISHAHPSPPFMPSGDHMQEVYPPSHGDRGRCSPGYQTSGMSNSHGCTLPPSTFHVGERRYQPITGEAGLHSPGRQTSRMSTGLALFRFPQEAESEPLDNLPGRQEVPSAPADNTHRRYQLITGEAGLHSPGRQTSRMSTGLALFRFPQEAESEPLDNLPGRQEVDVHSAPADYTHRRGDLSVLELAGFDGPEGDTSARPWKPLTRPRQEAWARPAVGTRSVRTVRDQGLEDPPLPERWDARDAVCQPQETGVDGRHQTPVNRIRSPPRPPCDPATHIGNSSDPRILYESSAERIPLPDRLGRGGTCRQQTNQGGYRHEPSRMDQTYGARREPHCIYRANPAPQGRHYPHQPALYGPSSVGITLPGVLQPVPVNSAQPSAPWCDGRDTRICETQHGVPHETRMGPSWQAKPPPVYERWAPHGPGELGQAQMPAYNHRDQPSLRPPVWGQLPADREPLTRVAQPEGRYSPARSDACSIRSDSPGQSGTHPGLARGRTATRGNSRKPDTFDGNSIEWSDYLELFDSVAEWNGWTRPEKAAQLRMSLRGPALKVLKMLPPEDKSDYGKLCKAMESGFDPPERVLTHKAAFKSRIRHAKETPSEFGNALRTLAGKAYPLKPLAELDEVLLDQFVEGLSDDRLQEHILLGHPQTLSQAIQVATEFESLQQSRVKRATKPKVAALRMDNPPVAVSTPPTTGKLEEMLGRLEQRIDRLEKSPAKTQGPAKGKREIECFYCKKKGHMKRDCRKKQADEQAQASGRVPPATPAAPTSAPDHLNGLRLGPQPQTQPRQ